MNFKQRKMNRKKKRKEIFDLYSKDFRKITENAKLNLPYPLYVCPLCRRYFSEKYLDQAEKNPLTIEHVPPENSGGKDLILTCKECNNNHGSWFDSHLNKMDEYEKFLNLVDNTELKTSFTLNGKVKIGSTIKVFPNNSIAIFMDSKRTNPKYHEEINRLASNPNESLNIEFNLPIPDVRRISIALLRSAYLLMFKKLGYKYVLCKNTEYIRLSVQNFNTNLKAFNAIVNSGFDNKYLGIHKISEPNWLQGRFLVIIKIKTDAFNTNYGLILPGLYEKERIDYDNLKPKIGETKLKPFNPQDLYKMNFELVDLPV